MADIALHTAWITEDPTTVTMVVIDGIGKAWKDTDTHSFLIYGDFIRQTPFLFSQQPEVLHRQPVFIANNPVLPEVELRARVAIAKEATRIAGGDAVLASRLQFSPKPAAGDTHSLMWELIHSLPNNPW